MKRLITALVAIVAVYVMAGCSEKFKVAAPYKDITVVYGFLEISDTAHYIRIQKAFLDQNKSALVMSQSPDSNFYANLRVKIERFTFDNTTHPVDSISLTRVDLNTEGYPKQPGAFFTAPNYAYKFTNKLDPKYIYRLVITNLTTGKVDSAQSPIIDDTNPTSFSIDQIDTTQHLLMDFKETVGNRYFDITGQYIPVSNFSFQGLSNPAVIGQTIVRFKWDDSDAATHAHTPHYYDYNAGFFTVAANGGIDMKIQNTSLYSGLQTALDPAPANTYRLLNRVDLFIYLSTQDFLTYQQTSLTQGTGLTGSEIEPIYTNISGDNSVGLFTARGIRTGTITMAPLTIDSLMASPLLSSAKIVGTVYHP